MGSFAAEVDLDEDGSDGEEARAASKPVKKRSTGGDGDGADDGDGESGLLTETVKPRDLSQLPPLFTRLEERRAERLHYLGVSYGLTQVRVPAFRGEDGTRSGRT